MHTINNSEYCCDKCGAKVSVSYPQYPKDWPTLNLQQSDGEPLLVGSTLHAAKDYCPVCAVSILEVLQVTLKSHLMRWSDAAQSTKVNESGSIA